MIQMDSGQYCSWTLCACANPLQHASEMTFKGRCKPHAPQGSGGAEKN